MDSLEPTVGERLAGFAIAAEAPEEVRERAVTHLLDTVGCGLAALGLGAGKAPSEVASRQGGRPESALLGADAAVPAPLAALANGARFHALDYDDTHDRGICHASAVIAATALAIGEGGGHSGRQALDAYVIGCEVAVRVAIGAATGLYQHGFHPTGVCGAVGAAAAAARLEGLDHERATNALGIVVSFSSGLLEYLSDGSETKPLHAGWAAQAGIQAARMAGASASGPQSGIDGRFGLLASHTGEPTPSPAILDGLGARWEAAAMSLKAYPVCHFAHASTWAAAELVATHQVELAEIAAIVVRISPEGLPLVLEPASAKARPRTAYEAKFSLPYAISHNLVHGDLGISAFTREAIGDPRVLELAARVEHEPLAAAERGRSRFAGGARIVTRGGATYDLFVADPPGSPANPLAAAAITGKFAANAAAAGLSAGLAEELRQRLLGLAEEGSLDQIGAILKQGREGGTGA